MNIARTLICAIAIMFCQMLTSCTTSTTYTNGNHATKQEQTELVVKTIAKHASDWRNKCPNADIVLLIANMSGVDSAEVLNRITILVPRVTFKAQARMSYDKNDGVIDKETGKQGWLFKISKMQINENTATLSLLVRDSREGVAVYEYTCVKRNGEWLVEHVEYCGAS